MPDHGRLFLQLANHLSVVVGHLSYGLVGEHLGVSVGLLDGLGVIGPSWRERRVAGLVENRGPTVPATWQQPQAVDKYNRLLGALALMPAWTVLSVRFAHLDDVLALLLAVAAIRAVVAQRPILAGLALAGAVAAKPWAVGFFPLLLVLDQQRILAVVSALAGVCASWAPFIITNPATLAALHPPVGVAPWSGLHALGYLGDIVPAWGRAAQFFLEPLAALAPVLRRRWPGLFLVAVAVRLAMDPKDNPYYIGGAALAAVIFDLLATRWTIPWATLTTVVLLWQPWAVDYEHRLETSTGLSHWWFQNPGIVGMVHIGWSLAMIALVLLTPRWILERAAPAPLRPPKLRLLWR